MFGIFRNVTDRYNSPLGYATILIARDFGITIDLFYSKYDLFFLMAKISKILIFTKSYIYN